MTTDTATPFGRQTQFQQIHYLRKTVNYNDTGIGTADTVKMPARLPVGAQIMFVMVRIKTAFNAGTTNVLTVGSNATSNNNMVTAGDVDETATGANMVLRGADLDFTSDTPVYVLYTQTGTAATAGVAVITIAYVVNNDG